VRKVGFVDASGIGRDVQTRAALAGIDFDF
jgi:hypothetical protein